MAGDPYNALEKFLKASHELALQDGSLQERLEFAMNEFVNPVSEEDLPWDVVDTFQQLRREAREPRSLSDEAARRYIATILTITSELELQLSRV